MTNPNAVDIAIAAAPILLLISWITKRSPLASAVALPLAASIAYLIRLAWFGTDANVVNASVLAGLLMVGDDGASVMLIGNSLAKTTGGWWQYLAVLLGALGAFFAGSCTISNLTFGPL